MLKLRNCVQSGLMYNKNYMSMGKQAWVNPQSIAGYDNCLRAAQSMTWQDCLNCTGLNPDDCFKEELSTHVVYEMNKLRIMLILFKGGQNMPIHDHEGMVVFCKVLKGKIGVDYWDYENLEHVKKHIASQDYDNIKHNGVPVQFKGSYDMKEGELDIVTPFKNNLHRFRPEQNSVVLDLIINDYDDARPHKGYIKRADDLLQLNSVNRVCI